MSINTNTTEARSAIFSAAHAMTRRTIKPGDSYAVTFAAALKIAYAEYGKSAAELWTSYSDDEKYNALKAMAGYEYQRRDSRSMIRNGQLVPLANVFTWVNPANVADDLTSVAHQAYIKVIDYLADERRADWTLSRILSRAVIIAAQKISRAERRNPSALRHDNEGREFIDTQDQATAEPIAPDPYIAAAVLDSIERAAKDDKDRLIMKALAYGYTARQIAAALGMSHTAINKRIAGIKARYEANNAPDEYEPDTIAYRIRKRLQA